MLEVILILLSITGVKSFADAKENRPFPSQKSGNLGLLSNDFGILDENDLKANACQWKPMPFPPEFSEFQYWHCYETKNLTWEFDQGRATPGDREGLPVLVAREGSSRDEYLFKRTWLIEEYREVIHRWKKLTRHQSHVCVSAPYLSTNANEEGGQTRSWIFGKYKTRLGCAAYFDGECDTRKAIRESCPQQ